MEMSYKEAIAEIEAILRSLREEQNSVDTLAERVARATELIALCRCLSSFFVFFAETF